MLCCIVTALFSRPVCSFGADYEELAPGYNSCMESATGTYEMLQCGHKAYQYWEEELNESYKRLRWICNNPEGHDYSTEQCLKQVGTLEKNCQEYRNQAMEFIHMFYGRDDEMTARLEAQRFNITGARQQARELGEPGRMLLK